MHIISWYTYWSVGEHEGTFQILGTRRVPPGYPYDGPAKPLEQSSADGLLERQHLEVEIPQHFCYVLEDHQENLRSIARTYSAMENHFRSCFERIIAHPQSPA